MTSGNFLNLCAPECILGDGVNYTLIVDVRVKREALGGVHAQCEQARLVALLSVFVGVSHKSSFFKKGLPYKKNLKPLA